MNLNDKTIDELKIMIFDLEEQIRHLQNNHKLLYQMFDVKRQEEKRPSIIDKGKISKI